MDTSKDLKESLELLKLKRKNGEISEKEYYFELLKLLKRLSLNTTVKMFRCLP